MPDDDIYFHAMMMTTAAIRYGCHVTCPQSVSPAFPTLLCVLEKLVPIVKVLTQIQTSSSSSFPFFYSSP